jgi:flagellar L-ring protein precursor FlgH
VAFEEDRPVKTARIAIAILLLAGLASAGAESLWSPDFKGYLSGGASLAAGDVLVVDIDASSSLSFSASNTDSKNLTLEFSGGESGNLFSFLPQVRTGGAQSAKGKEELSLRTQVPVVVAQVGADGRAQVQGSRSISVEGKEESITVSGLVDPRLVDSKRRIALSQLAGARLVYRTFLRPSRETLTQRDLQEIFAAQPAPAAAGSASATGTTAAAGTATTAAGTTAAAAPAAAAQPAARTLTITETRKRELLLLYLNSLIDVLFAR